MSQEEWQSLDVIQYLIDNTAYFYTYYLKKMCSNHGYNMSFEEAQSILIAHCTSRLKSIHQRNLDATGQRRLTLLRGTTRMAIETEIRAVLFTNYFTDAFSDVDKVLGRNHDEHQESAGWHSKGYENVVTSASYRSGESALHAAEKNGFSLTSDDVLMSSEKFEKRQAYEQKLSDQIEELRCLPELVGRRQNKYTAKQHEIFRMRTMDSLTPGQIAVRQGCTANNIIKLHKRVMASLEQVANERSEKKRRQA